MYDQRGKHASLLAAVSMGLRRRSKNCIIRPEATITSHDESVLLYSDYQAMFRGQVSDPNHPTTSLMVQWRMNNEILCDWNPPDESGESLCSHTPTEDQTHLELIVKDPLDATATADLNLNLMANQAPVVEILFPQTQDTLLVEQPILFSGQVIDDVEPTPSLTLSWHSNRDGD